MMMKGWRQSRKCWALVYRFTIGTPQNEKTDEGPNVRAPPGRLGEPDRLAAARAMRGGHLSRQRTGRAEAQQDIVGGPHPASAQRPDRDRRGEPLAARKPGPRFAANAPSALSQGPRRIAR